MCSSDLVVATRERDAVDPAKADGSAPLESDDPFEDLRSWLLDPQNTWLRSLGMCPGERREDLDDLEPLELEERDRAPFLRDALASGTQPPLDADPFPSAEAWLLRHRGEGRFPAARGAAVEAAKLQERWGSLQEIGRAHV